MSFILLMSLFYNFLTCIEDWSMFIFFTLVSFYFQVKDIEDIISLSHQEKYNEACKVYLVNKAKIHSNEKKYSYCSIENIGNTSLHTNRQKSNSTNSKLTLSENKEVSHVVSHNVTLNFTCPSDFYLILSAYRENNTSYKKSKLYI